MSTNQTPAQPHDRAPHRPTGLIVYPSLHWWVSITQIDPSTSENGKFDMGAGEEFEKILGELKRGSMVAIEGTRGTFKTTFAVNFLAKGLLEGESVLLVHFGERSLLRPNNISINHPIRHRIYKHLEKPRSEGGKFQWDNLKLVKPTEELKWKTVAIEKKIDIHVWKNQSNPKSRFIELDFKSGMLLPEEFVSIVCKIISIMDDKKNNHEYVPIRRVVLDDVSLIGVSYPLLRSSSTTGQFFLSAFVHLMQYHKIDLVITGTLGDQPEANESVYRAAALADKVVSCRYCNVFGQRSVVVRADGMMVGREQQRVSTVESVPALVKWENPEGSDKQTYFELDFEHLEGLVGFESDNIHRPGLLLYLFSEYDDKNSVQEHYNRSLETLIKSAIGRPQELPDRVRDMFVSPSDVSISMFNSKESEAIHDSIRVLKGGPLDRTVIYTVDEFWATAEVGEDESLSSKQCEEGEKEDQDQKEDKDQQDEQVEQEFLTAALEISKSAAQTEGATKEESVKGIAEKKAEIAYHQTSEPIAYLKKSHAVRPYYANVLLLAFRRDIEIFDDLIPVKKDSENNDEKDEYEWVRDIRKYLNEQKLKGGDGKAPVPTPPPPQSWIDVKHLAEVLQKSRLRLMRSLVPQQLGAIDLPDETNPPNDPPAFWFDRAASETLACALMDALVAGSSKNDVKKFRSMAKTAIDSGQTLQLREHQKRLYKLFFKKIQAVSDTQLKEIHALSDLFYMSESGKKNQVRLIENASIYLCWYSQLRELIDKHPELAEKIDVCPLPGGGFTGDWFVGIARGSVSLGLGASILDLLCSKEEEYKRFALGVGLPTTADFYTKQFTESGKITQGFFAWPLGQHVFVERLREIHLQAFSRAFIPQYTKFRSALAMVAFQLTPMSGMIADQDERRKAIDQNVQRLPGQIQMLGELSKGDSINTETSENIPQTSAP